MTPYELAKLIHQDISSFAPKLSAALNRALVDIGEGSVILGLGPGTHENDPATFREIEEIDIAGTHKAEIIARISSALVRPGGTLLLAGGGRYEARGQTG